MRTISEQELKIILDKHGKWLRNEEGGEKADLSYANLRSADLSYADLRYADLRYADLCSADLMSFQFQRDVAFYTFDGALRIGCVFMPITEWVLGYQEIGKSNGYTEEQIKMYGKFIEMCAEHFKQTAKAGSEG